MKINGDEVTLQSVEGGWILEYRSDHSSDFKRVFSEAPHAAVLRAVAGYLGMEDVEVRDSSPSAGAEHGKS